VGHRSTDHVCKSPFPSAGTAVSLFCVKTVQQRTLLQREVETCHAHWQEMTKFNDSEHFKHYNYYQSSSHQASSTFLAQMSVFNAYTQLVICKKNQRSKNKCVSRTDTNPPFAFQIAFPRGTGFYRERQKAIYAACKRPFLVVAEI